VPAPDVLVQIGGSGTAFYDVTSYTTSVTISRGLSRELDRFTTGSANLSFTNQTRAFDPFYTSSPFYPNIQPRKNMKVSTIVSGSTAVQFTGLVEDWSLDFEVEGDSTASAACVDGFILFGGQQLNQHTATAQTTGARIGAVLDRTEVAWSASLRDLDTGVQTLQADVVEQGREVLEYLQLVAASEPGLLFMSTANKVTFRDRNAGALAPGTVVFSDAGTAIPYTDIEISYGTELLYNRVGITPIGLETQLASNTTSQTTYGVQSLEVNGLLLPLGAQGTADAAALAAYYANKYGDPDLRFNAIAVELAALTATQQSVVLALELADIVTIQFQPSRVGDRVSKAVQIIGIRHQIRPKQHTVEFMLASTDTVAFVFGSSSDPTANPVSLFAGGTVVGSPFGL
jgi:hypothetical protein